MKNRVYSLLIGLIIVCFIGANKLTAQSANTYREARVTVVNNSNSDISMQVERIINHMDSSCTVSSFCFGAACYPPSTSLSPGLDVIAACSYDHTFKGEYKITDSTGCYNDTSSITYCFKDVNDPLNEQCLTFYLSGNSPEYVYDTLIFGSGGCQLVATGTGGVTSAPGVCDGTASVLASGGTWVYAYLWDDPSSQTNSIASNLCAGTYNVTVTDTTGSTTSVSVVVDEGVVILVEEATVNENSIQIYPNPARNWINLEYTIKGKSNDAWFVLRNMLGAIKIKMKLYGSSGKIKIPSRDHNQGIYFYSLIVDDKISETKKLIIDN